MILATSGGNLNIEYRTTDGDETRLLAQADVQPAMGLLERHRRNATTIDDEVAKLRLVVETAREVGGSA